MEERGGLLGFATRQSSLRAPSSPRPSSTSRSVRRLSSGPKTPRRESRSFQWSRNNVVFWLILITLWAYIGFHVQSKWAHGDHGKAEFVGYKSSPGSVKSVQADAAPTLPLSPLDATTKTEPPVRNGSDAKRPPPKKGRKGKSSKRVVRKLQIRTGGEAEYPAAIPIVSNSSQLIVGPFNGTEDRVLGWSPERRKGTCDRKSEFSKLVWSRSFLLVFHEMSMTGAPLSMMELGTEILSCGGSVSAVILSRKGGLMGEIVKRGIKVLKDKGNASFKTAMKRDLVIAGSAVCSAWIEQYLSHNPAGSGQLVWWIMENRREYFDRSKHLLNRVKMLMFLSNSQSKQWLAWSGEEHIQFNSEPMVVPLSVNDELAFVAGIPCSLNTLAFSAEKMLEKRDLLRTAVRKEMGLDDNEMLVMSLSSINPAKGQRLLLESALLVTDHNVSFKDPKSFGVLDEQNISGVALQNETIMDDKPSKVQSQKTSHSDTIANDMHTSNATSAASKKKRRKHRKLTKMSSLGNHKKIATDIDQHNLRSLLTESEGRQEQPLKVLIGSVGSKSNKVLYVKAILRFLSQHSNFSKSVLWTPATTRVSSLYSAADAYVINAQGLGETFGRVTIEAMAFGLPVLGTDAGGTKEIVDHGATGLLHPLGREGIMPLAQNIEYLLRNPSTRKKMGMKGRLKVQNMYLKHHMYKRLTIVLTKCMKPK